MGGGGEPQAAALLHAMLASSLDAVIAMDASGRVVNFNLAAERTFGYGAADARGRDVGALIVPPRLRDRHYAALRRYLDTGRSTILNRRVEVVGMNSEGAEFPVELTVTRVPVDGSPLFMAYLRDITDRKLAEQELKESRTRLVESADRERRRIERDLHDGAQQRLLTISVLLQRLAVSGVAPELHAVVDLAQTEAGRAIEELRELTRGLYPPALNESGLAAALHGVALRVPLEVEVDVPDERRLPPSVEIAFYFVASEALTNVVKHARAARAGVRLTIDDGTATLAVSDDGVGGAEASLGSGLQGLGDRVTALDGTLTVASAPGAGTTVTARIPV